jgi:formylglycine-generating enzyme required for sulfatase activity
MLLAEILDKPFPSLAAARRDVPPDIERLIARCTARRPEDRFASWADFFDALEGVGGRRAAFDPTDLAALLVHAHPEKCAAARQRAVEDACLDLDRALASFDPGPLAPIDLVPLGPRAEDTRTLPRARPYWLDEPSIATTLPIPDAWGTDARPMARAMPGLLVDWAPVTSAEYARFVIATDRAPPPSWEGCYPPWAEEEAPVVWVTLEDAAAYAAWAGKRIPDSDEWERAVERARSSLVLGQVWELTRSSPIDGGWVVRGGRWRDHPQMPARPGNLSRSGAAADVGFRCVADG